jgi:hypothetical protein
MNCYHIVGDTDAHTTAGLQVQFERASTDRPCILIIRHLEAFDQLNTGSNTDEGSSRLDVAGRLTDSSQCPQLPWHFKNV